MKRSRMICRKRLLVGILALTLLLSACAATGRDPSGSQSTTASTGSAMQQTTQSTSAEEPFVYTVGMNEEGKVIFVSKHSPFAANVREGSVFDTDMYLFYLEATPTDWDGVGSVDLKYDLTISCGDVQLDQKNNESEHILFYAYPYDPSPIAEQSAFIVVGWFAEPTELLFTFTDLETGAVAETQKYLISYDASTEEYDVARKE